MSQGEPGSRLGPPVAGGPQLLGLGGPQLFGAPADLLGLEKFELAARIFRDLYVRVASDRVSGGLVCATVQTLLCRRVI